MTNAFERRMVTNGDTQFVGFGLVLYFRTAQGVDYLIFVIFVLGASTNGTISAVAWAGGRRLIPLKPRTSRTSYRSQESVRLHVFGSAAG